MSFTGIAPGRVNLIGEHIDYNGGMVLPAALSIGLEVQLTPRTDDRVLITANTYEEPAERVMGESANGEWSDPAMGALIQAQKLDLLPAGAELAINSTIPEGSGLSSSAALIVAILKAAKDFSASSITDTQIAIEARAVENEYMGVPCGIMDQMAVALATPGSAMALDTSTLTFELVDLPATHAIVVVHSGLTRKLTDGRYAERKVECDAAKAHFGTDDLCHLEQAAVEAADLNEAIRKRTRHCVSEHARVLDAIEALRSDDIPALAAAMNASHISMRDDFEMSLPAIDALVADAVRLGADGARLTGGGFGGCIVALVEKEKQNVWLDTLLNQHPEARFIAAA